MGEQSIYERLGSFRVIPVVAIESVDGAIPLADALLHGGLPVAEITFRTAAAADVIGRLKSERAELLVGAGTVLTPENVRRAKACGAEFAVAPGFNPDVVKAAQDAGLPFAPGVMTPSDVEGALALGLKAVKFFPAGAAGGPDFLKSMAAPFLHTGVRFIPTGGVSLSNMLDYLKRPEVLAVGGTWIATKETIAAGRWESIAENCREVRQIVNALH